MKTKSKNDGMPKDRIYDLDQFTPKV